jgi:hypothetical protein
VFTSGDIVSTQALAQNDALTEDKKQMTRHRIALVPLALIAVVITMFFAFSPRQKAAVQTASEQGVSTPTALAPIDLPTYSAPQNIDTEPVIPTPIPTDIPFATLAAIRALPEAPPDPVYGTPLPGTLVATMLPNPDVLKEPEPTATAQVRTFLPPDGVRRRYIDPNIGFEFVYPDNWNVISSGKNPDFKIDNGYFVGITNFNETLIGEDVKRDSRELKIEIYVLPDEARPFASESLERQVKEDATNFDYELISMRPVKIAGVEGIHVVVRSRHFATEVSEYMFRDPKQKHVYIVAATPAYTEHQTTILDLMNTFRLPQ